ncbi:MULTISPECIES: 4'-phosphopantetheinyl transferase family protein [Providencia]|uniref:4'-phosphopantetheinyl transferase family protein n=1 Tax=Providencia TaxID=586 RepID=UPI0018E40F2B|nr:MULTISPECIES: 4'-phosphopantetheinyl transferase superfamily protein [Providencia]MBI6191094.1 4'-phosphopantetheinyl transferase superfamily protein [Providencia rettgeri]MCL0017094.1 4'-phosphopantetheinyl transferase superfamily protein [Providencia rettgeri]MCX9125488.1 4'-phosphopantetheinyl transferase superfamily protein [Providencia rettgeri]MCX9130093.1 4'-phosphopantetheinyl transferase superfamily protein [Providencia rettgeri]
MNSLKSVLLSYIVESLPPSIVCTLYHQHEYQPEWRLQVAIPEDIQSSIPKRQNEYVSGRICAAEALQKLGSSKCYVGRDPQYAPKWPKGTVGSISHNEHWVIACVAWQYKYIGLGIDIETRINSDYLESMHQYIYTKNELILLEQADFDVLTASTILFSIKESAIKLLLSQNLTINNFKNIQVVQVNGNQIILRILFSTPKFLIGQFWVQQKTIVTLVTEK